MQLDQVESRDYDPALLWQDLDPVQELLGDLLSGASDDNRGLCLYQITGALINALKREFPGIINSTWLHRFNGSGYDSRHQGCVEDEEAFEKLRLLFQNLPMRISSGEFNVHLECARKRIQIAGNLQKGRI
jgi:hypothetical protein